MGGIHITIAGGDFKEDDPAWTTWQTARIEGRIGLQGTGPPPDCRH
jgi:hypothetical protein